MSMKGGVDAEALGRCRAFGSAGTELFLDFIIKGPLLRTLLLCDFETLSGAEWQGDDTGHGGCLVVRASVEG
jgi:hypothetical protein